MRRDFSHVDTTNLNGPSLLSKAAKRSCRNIRKHLGNVLPHLKNRLLKNVSLKLRPLGLCLSFALHTRFSSLSPLPSLFSLHPHTHTYPTTFASGFIFVFELSTSTSRFSHFLAFSIDSFLFFFRIRLSCTTSKFIDMSADVHSTSETSGSCSENGMFDLRENRNYAEALPRNLFKSFINSQNILSKSLSY